MNDALQVLVHSYYLNTWDTWTRVVTVTDGMPIMTVSTPADDVGVTQPFGITGWAIDPASTSGSGIDAAAVWAYPNPGSGNQPLVWGYATLGGATPDVATTY